MLLQGGTAIGINLQRPSLLLPFQRIHFLMSWAWRGAAFCCKANKSYQGKVTFSLISKENKAKETRLVVTGVKNSCEAIKEMIVQRKGCLTVTHELLMMFCLFNFASTSFAKGECDLKVMRRGCRVCSQNVTRLKHCMACWLSLNDRHCRKW